MGKTVALVLVLFFVIASCIAVKPAMSSSDVTEDSWVSKTPMQQERGGLGVVVANGKIYAIGGSTASGTYPPGMFYGGFVGTNEEYDPETDAWTYREPMPTPRAHFAIAAYKNKIYCIGGAVGFTVEQYGTFHSYITSGVTEVYDTVTNTWVTKKSMPDDAMKIQAHIVNGKIYVMDWSQVYVYDPDEDSWSLKARMPQPYPDSSPVSTVFDNKIIVTFEFSTFNFPIGFESSEQKILVYDTETDTWNGGKSGPIAVVQGAAGATTGVKAPQRVYVLGLIVEALLPTVVNQVYDPKTDTWATATTMLANRSDFGVAVVNDLLYIIGGYLRGSRRVTPTAMNEQYTPIGFGVPPEINVVSPLMDQTYDVSNVSLVFTVNKTVGWMGYSLDGLDNVTVAGNTTVGRLANGLHNLTVYAEDSFGNMGASEIVSFSVEVPFPMLLVVSVSAVSVIIAGVGLLVYFKKRRAKSGG